MTKFSSIILQTGLRSMAARDAFRNRAQSNAAVINQVITYLPVFLYHIVCGLFHILTE